MSVSTFSSPYSIVEEYRKVTSLSLLRPSDSGNIISLPNINRTCKRRVDGLTKGDDMGQKGKQMTTATLNTRLAPARKTGRKRKPGNWAHDPYLNISGPFACYCPNCEYAIIMPADSLRLLMMRYQRNNRSLIVRIVKHLLALKSV